MPFQEIHSRHGSPHRGGRERNGEAPRAQGVDLRVGLVEQPVGKDQPEGVNGLGGQQEPPREAHLEKPSDGDGDDHGLGKDAEERIGKPKKLGLPRDGHFPAVQSGRDVA